MIIGRLGADPEVRYTQSNTAVATLSVATSNKWKDKNGEQHEDTEWHRVVLWGRTAEVAQEYLSKGSQVYIEGPLQTREWEDKDGVKRYTTEIKGLNLVMLSSNNQQNRPPQPKQEPTGTPAVNLDYEDLDDDLPF